MNNRKILGALVLFMFLLTGCIGKERPFMGTESSVEKESEQTELVLGDLSNLNVSKIADNISLPAHLYKMTAQMEGEWNHEKIYDEIPKLIAAYGGPQEDKLDMEKELLFLEAGTTEVKPLGERAGEKINRIMYTSDTLYLEIDSIMQVFMHQPALIERITGKETNRKNEWLPYEHADSIATYYVGEDDLEKISYVLDGQETLLTECVEYVEETLTDNESLPRVSTPGFEYKVEYVDVYQYGDNYGLYFTVNLYYEDVKLFTETGVRFDSPPGLTQNYIPTIDRCMMFRKDELNQISTFDWLTETQDSVEEVEPAVDYKKALQVLSGYLSDTHEFRVIDAQLVYSFYAEYKTEKGVGDSVNYITPVWMFEISTEGAQMYDRIFILIDVQTGEVVELYA